MVKVHNKTVPLHGTSPILVPNVGMLDHCAVWFGTQKMRAGNENSRYTGRLLTLVPNVGMFDHCAVWFGAKKMRAGNEISRMYGTLDHCAILPYIRFPLKLSAFH